MQRLYAACAAEDVDTQIHHINNSSMSQEEKEIFMRGIFEADKSCEKIIKDLQMDSPTQYLLLSFCTVVRMSVKKEFENFTKLRDLKADDTDKDAKEKLNKVTGDATKTENIWAFMKKAASGFAKAIFTVAGYMFDIIKYFAKKGFDLIRWILNHPTTVMWMAYAALYLKKKLCAWVSLKMYTDPEIIEVGLLGKAEDVFVNQFDIPNYIKKTFLSNCYSFISSPVFGEYVQLLKTVIENGLYIVLSYIPVVGITISKAIQTSGGLTFVMDAIALGMTEAMYYGITAVVLREAGNDIYALITGTCLKRPEIKKITLGGIQTETGDFLKTMVSAVARERNPDPGVFEAKTFGAPLVLQMGAGARSRAKPKSKAKHKSKAKPKSKGKSKLNPKSKKSFKSSS
jgi:hypothetical protein